jgi:hypothetical protein
MLQKQALNNIAAARTQRGAVISGGRRLTRARSVVTGGVVLSPDFAKKLLLSFTQSIYYQPHKKYHDCDHFRNEILTIRHLLLLQVFSY